MEGDLLEPNEAHEKDDTYKVHQEKGEGDWESREEYNNQATNEKD